MIYDEGWRCMLTGYLKVWTQPKGCNTRLEAIACQGKRGPVLDKS